MPGVYTVTLTVSGLGGSDTLTRTGYITVTWPIISRVITYTYDDLYRLTGADYSSGEQFEYGYDAVGNRTVHTQTITSTTVTTYTYPSTALRAGDAANRLDYFYQDGVQTELTWDDNGNFLTQGTSVYTWDAANRLVSAGVGGVVSTFAYNGLGQRTSQTVGGTTTEYVLDTSVGLSASVAGSPSTALRTGLPEVIVATSGGASTYYVQIQGQILAQQESGAWAYVLPDHLGSVRQLTNAGGQVTLAQSHDPFGVLFESAGSEAVDCYLARVGFRRWLKPTYTAEGAYDVEGRCFKGFGYLPNSVVRSVCRGMSRCSATSLRIALSVPTRSDW